MAVVNPLRVTDFWGNARIEPSVYGIVHVGTQVQQRVQAFRDVVLLSMFDGGPTEGLPVYTDPTEMHAALDPQGTNGQGIQMADYARVPTYDPRIPGAFRIYAARVGQPTASALTLQHGLASPTDVLRVESRDTGAYVNKISLEVMDGTVMGRRVIVRYGTEETVSYDNLRHAVNLAYIGNATLATLTIFREGDRAVRLQTALTGATDGSVNLDIDLTAEEWNTLAELAQMLNAQNGYRAALNTYADPMLPPTELDQVVADDIRTVGAFSIQYTGTGTACTMSITDTTLTTTVTSGQPADTLALSFIAEGTETLGLLVSALNATGVYTASVGPHADPETLLAFALAPITAQDIKTAAYTAKADPGLYAYATTAELGSIVYALETRSARCTATRLPGAIHPPALMAQTFLQGGSNPPATVQDWIDALERVKQEDLLGGHLLLNTASATLHDIALAWIVEQRKMHGTTFRAFFGAPPGLSSATYRTLATAMNSTWATLACQRVLAPDGVTELDPVYVAAIMCGLASGVPFGQTTTNIAIRCRSLIDRYSLGQREDMMASGLSVLKEMKGRGVITAFSLTTSLSSARMYRVLSESMNIDLIDQNVRLVLLDFLGAWATKDLIPKVKGRVLDILNQLIPLGAITTGIDQYGTILPAYAPPGVGLKAGLLNVVWRAWVGGEVSQIAVQGFVEYQVFELNIPLSQ